MAQDTPDNAEVVRRLNKDSERLGKEADRKEAQARCENKLADNYEAAVADAKKRHVPDLNKDPAVAKSYQQGLEYMKTGKCPAGVLDDKQASATTHKPTAPATKKKTGFEFDTELASTFANIAMGEHHEVLPATLKLAEGFVKAKGAMKAA